MPTVGNIGSLKCVLDYTVKMTAVKLFCVVVICFGIPSTG